MFNICCSLFYGGVLYFVLPYFNDVYVVRPAT